ncbi:amino acid deaminase/aldolase [Luteimicrobium subarcticum]|uniref:D-serine deaminase-like pyridoxal phosphate-dependent protein n=1 Tax=Luteimicrobium subarcticum TaxID=620910 RepID=A0A2M8WUQ1_9MICO|nr:amino acid deaminase/aldolase [Luteimicrobium subarcticum]PJI94629.1 D-serine deaminase-like pyridoxal phosphate-dependent protein [Luteimicrobium subarcticum]
MSATAPFTLPRDAPASVADPGRRPWTRPETYWPALTAATEHLDPPYATLDLRALAHNAHDLLRRAGGVPVRVASKSLRVRSVIDAVLALPGYAGVLGYTLPEALWLASDTGTGDGEHRAIEDVVVGYPSVDRAALRRLATDPALAARVTIMVDDVAQLDLVDSVLAPGEREEIRVCLELDASWDVPGLAAALGTVGRADLAHVGVLRSPVHTAARARTLAQLVADRPGFRLVGMMAYEAQIAGLANATAGARARSAVIRRLQAVSATELRGRRGEAVAAVREVADLAFVNAGGTGSLESSAADASVTELTAGSGLFGPHLFDNYAHFTPAPAVAFTLPVVRQPAPGVATLLGGGWVASGPPGPDRLPQVAWPTGTRYVGTEGAGEVQTPLRGAPQLRVGDRAWMRHTKSGEVCEHVDTLVVLDADGGDAPASGGDGVGHDRLRVVGDVPTYRGHGKAFL